MNELVRQLFLILGHTFMPVAVILAIVSPIGGKPTPTPTPTPTVTSTPTPSPSPTPTQTPTPKPTNTPTPGLSPTPSLSPTSTQPPVSGGQLDEWFSKYSSLYSVDRQKLWNVAVCESGLRPNARNGDYGGLYQFASSTWINTRKAMNLDTNPDLRFNPEEAIRTAAFKISTVGYSPWPNCGR